MRVPDIVEASAYEACERVVKVLVKGHTVGGEVVSA